MVSTVRPKAMDTPTKPIPSAGKAAASTALPQPPSTSHRRPTNSAPRRLIMFMPPSLERCARSQAAARLDARPALASPPSGVTRSQPAINRDDRAGDVGGGRQAEAERDMRHLFRLAIAAQRRAAV